MARMIRHHQPDGIANANILDLSGWEVWRPSVTPNTGDRSTPRIFAFGSCPPMGVAGEPDDAGEVVLEKLGEGVSGVLGFDPQATLFGVPGPPDLLAEVPLWVKPGTGLDVEECSWRGVLEVEASALAARLETKEVGYVG